MQTSADHHNESSVMGGCENAVIYRGGITGRTLVTDGHHSDQHWWSSTALHSYERSLDKQLHWWSRRGTDGASSGHSDIVLSAMDSYGQSDSSHTLDWPPTLLGSDTKVSQWICTEWPRHRNNTQQTLCRTMASIETLEPDQVQPAAPTTRTSTM